MAPPKHRAERAGLPQRRSPRSGRGARSARRPHAGPVRIGAFTAACLLVSNMIGTGIFGTTGFMAADLGRPSWILGLWALGGLYALCGAFAYAELGAALPRAGGEYVYIREAFGKLAGFLSGWTSFAIAFGAAIAANAVLFAGHARELALAGVHAFAPAGSAAAWITICDRIAQAKGFELALVWTLTVVHCAGLGAGAFVQRLLTILKVGALLVLLAAGFTLGEGSFEHFAPDPAALPDVGWSVALVSFLYVSFSYSGWNASSYVADELEDPARDLPRSMIAGTLVVAALYLGLNALYVYAQPIEAMAGEPLIGHASARALFGPTSGRWFTGLLAVSIAGATSAMVWAGPRVYRSMAEDGVFPRFFAGSARNVPVRSIVLQSAWVSVLVVLGSFEALVKYASAILILFAGLGVLAVFVLRRTQPELARPYRAWGYPWLPALYLGLSVAILCAAVSEQIAAWRGGERTSYLLAGVVTVLCGLPGYALWTRSASKAR